MKKLIAVLLVGCAGLAGASAAPGTISRSSYTKTNDTTACILTQPGYLSRVIVGATSAGGSLTLYNSSWTNTPVLSSITLGTLYSYDFDDTNLKGLCYTTISNLNGVNIIYKKE